MALSDSILKPRERVQRSPDFALLRLLKPNSENLGLVSGGIIRDSILIGFAESVFQSTRLDKGAAC